MAASVSKALPVSVVLLILLYWVIGSVLYFSVPRSVYRLVPVTS